MSDVIDQIYEAAAVPELWPNLLEKVAALAKAEGALLFVARSMGHHYVTSPKMTDVAEGYFSAGYQLVDDRTRRLFEKNHPGFLTDLDVFERSEWERDPIRQQFWEPRGLGWGMATFVSIPSGENIILHVERSLKTGPYEPELVPLFDALRPHFARAALLSARLAFERAKGAVAALEMLALPAAVLDLHGSLYVANDAFTAMIPEVFTDHPTGLRLRRPGADGLFQQSVRSANAGHDCNFSVPIAGDGRREAMVIHVLPVRGVANDIFSRSGVIVVVTTLARQDVLSAEVVQGLFDLTPAETRVARSVARGDTVSAIAHNHSVTEDTVRNQLKEIFAKTGTRRQAELVSLLRAMVPDHDATTKE